MAERILVDVEGRQLSLSNLDKVLYPETGFTKGEVINYYARIAAFMLPHVQGRCVTLRRWPDGVDGKSFFEKRCPKHRPDWVPVAFDSGSLGPGGESVGINYCQLNEPAALLWAANLAALEVHVPMAYSDDVDSPSLVVFDLDPGAPAGLAECCQVALDLFDVLAAVGLQALPKTSGSKGLQVYVPLNAGHSHSQASSFALAVGQLVVRNKPRLVLVEMAKSLREGRVFIDWSQNSRHKTTVCAYSLRGRSTPTVSTPITWDEVSNGTSGQLAQFSAAKVLQRVETFGDLFASCAHLKQRLPG